MNCFMPASAGLLAASLSLVACASTSLAQDTKPINIVVGFSAGGGYDAYARVLARHFGKHMVGNPRVIVQNMPGASGLKAVNWLNNGAALDGTVMTAFNPGLITESLLDPAKVQIKLSDFAWVGSISEDYRVCYAWSASGVKTPEDWLKKAVVNMGAPSPASSSYINQALMKNLLGMKVRHVLGYPGSAEERLAIERGELDGGCGAWSSNPPEWVKQRKITPIISFTKSVPNLDQPVTFIRGLVKTDEHRALIDVIIAPDIVGRPYIAAKGIPDERLALLRKAFDATVADRDFVADAIKMDLTVSPMNGADAEAQVRKIYQATPETIASLKASVK